MLSYVSPSCISLRSLSSSCSYISHILLNLPRKNVEKISRWKFQSLLFNFTILRIGSYMYNCTLRERGNGHRLKECLYSGESGRWVRVIQPPSTPPSKIKCIHQKVFLYMQCLTSSLNTMKLTLPFDFQTWNTWFNEPRSFSNWRNLQRDLLLNTKKGCFKAAHFKENSELLSRKLRCN